MPTTAIVKNERKKQKGNPLSLDWFFLEIVLSCPNS